MSIDAGGNDGMEWVYKVEPEEVDPNLESFLKNHPAPEDISALTVAAANSPDVPEPIVVNESAVSVPVESPRDKFRRLTSGPSMEDLQTIPRRPGSTIEQPDAVQPEKSDQVSKLANDLLTNPNPSSVEVPEELKDQVAKEYWRLKKEKDSLAAAVVVSPTDTSSPVLPVDNSEPIEVNEVVELKPMTVEDLHKLLLEQPQIHSNENEQDLSLGTEQLLQIISEKISDKTLTKEVALEYLKLLNGHRREQVISDYVQNLEGNVPEHQEAEELVEEIVPTEVIEPNEGATPEIIKPEEESPELTKLKREKWSYGARPEGYERTTPLRDELKKVEGTLRHRELADIIGEEDANEFAELMRIARDAENIDDLSPEQKSRLVELSKEINIKTAALIEEAKRLQEEKKKPVEPVEVVENKPEPVTPESVAASFVEQAFKGEEGENGEDGEETEFSLETLKTNIINSPDFQSLPAPIRQAIENRMQGKINRLAQQEKVDQAKEKEFSKEERIEKQNALFKNIQLWAKRIGYLIPAAALFYFHAPLLAFAAIGGGALYGGLNRKDQLLDLEITKSKTKIEEKKLQLLDITGKRSTRTDNALVSFTKLAALVSANQNDLDATKTMDAVLKKSGVGLLGAAANI